MRIESGNTIDTNGSATGWFAELDGIVYTDKEVFFSKVIEKFKEPIYWKIRSMVVLHEDTDDILQNSFLNAWKNIDNFKGESSISTWLYRIAINETIDFIRRKKKEQEKADSYRLLTADNIYSDRYFDGDKAQALLLAAVATLPEVQRTVFTLRYFHEMKYSEISNILNTSEGAIKASFHIASKKIHDFIESNDG